ncbi:metal-sulfur cluster assembly factor [Candidatus Uhrbacteria bacterium]|nr:metal-sulfur cluster assembly factor [Candidatus Uhrbacteria bacterium]
MQTITPVPKDKQTQDYWTLLNNVIDPELGFGIVDLGLVYDVVIEQGRATVVMTFTSMGCPMIPEITRRVEAEMMRYPGIEDVSIEVVWSPLWSPERVDENVRALLF